METNYDVYRAKTGLAKRMRVLLSGPGLIGKKHAELLAMQTNPFLKGARRALAFILRPSGPRSRPSRAPSFL